MNINKLREKAKKKIKQRYYVWRSCWNCNLAHKHLKKADYVINCLECGRWYYKGQDITEEE